MHLAHESYFTEQKIDSHSNSFMMSTKEEPCCFICHDGAGEEALICGVCSCRGDAGQVHLSCIVEHGKAKLSYVMDSDEFDVDIIRKAWWKCCVCKQFWSNGMALKMAEAFTKVADSDYPHRLDLKTEVLRLKLHAMQRTQHSNEEQERVAFDLVASVDDYTSSVSGEVTSFLIDNQQAAYMMLGDIALERGDARRAVEHYTKCRKLFENVKDNAWSLMKIDVYIATAKARLPEEYTLATSLRDSIPLFEDFFRLSMKTYGDVCEQALGASYLLENALMDSKQYIKYERQLMVSLKMSRQLHGANHPRTLGIQDDLEYVQSRGAKVISDLKDQYEVEIVEYNTAADKYVVKRAEGQVRTTFLIAASDLQFYNGTPVLCHGLIGVQKHYNGKLGELHDFNPIGREYNIYFDDRTAQSIKIKSDNARVMFELPLEASPGDTCGLRG